MIKATLNILGRVQGVGFRASTQRKARQLGLTGFVKNEPDSTVLAEVYGSEEKVDKFIDWANQGPMLANVKNVGVSKEKVETSPYESFTIKR